MNKFKMMSLASAVLLTALGAASATTVTVGQGSAVTTPTNQATFDAVNNGTSLLNYLEGGLRLSVNDSAFEGFDAFSTGTNSFDFYYGTGGNNSFVSIMREDGALMKGLEFRKGTGFFNCMDTDGAGCSFVWQTWRNGVMTDSGRVSNYDNGAVYGFADLAGFDELRVASFFDLTANFGGFQAIVIDDVRIGSADVNAGPVPAGAWLLGSAIAAYGVRRRRAGR